MQTAADILAEFPPISKAEWLERIAKDLKGRAMSDLDWHLSNELVVSPFVHADDFPEPVAPLATDATGWVINEDVDTADPAAANLQALEALTGGAESLTFQLATPPKADELSALLAGIHLDFIGLHFTGAGLDANPGAVLAGLAALAKDQHLDPAQLHGSLAYDPAAPKYQDRLHDWRYLADLTAYAVEHFPGFRCVTVDGAPFFQSPAGVGNEVAALLGQGNFYLKKLTERGLTAEKAASQIQFSVLVGPSYFVEIGKLRALRLGWLNVLKAWQAPLVLPTIEVRFAPEVYAADAGYGNLIGATTMAMSAVIGGAQSLTVRPYNAVQATSSPQETARGLRLARNIQHLLKMESFFDQVADPAAGSYYIETLTRQVAAASWHIFQQRP